MVFDGEPYQFSPAVEVLLLNPWSAVYVHTRSAQLFRRAADSWHQSALAERPTQTSTLNKKTNYANSRLAQRQCLVLPTQQPLALRWISVSILVAVVLL